MLRAVSPTPIQNKHIPLPAKQQHHHHQAFDNKHHFPHHTQMAPAQINHLNEEIQRLHKILQNRDNQIEDLKAKKSPDVDGLERLRIDQAKHEAELLYEIESLRTQLTEKEQPIVKYTHQKELVESQSRILYLTEQVSQNERVLAMKQEEIKILMARITELEERKDVNAKLHEAEQRTHTILDKLERVTHRLHERTEECDKLKSLVTVREAEISEWRVKSTTSDQLGVQIKGLEQRVVLLAQENDRLTSMLHQRNNDIANLKSQLNERNDKWSQQEDRIGHLQLELNSRLGERSQQYEIDQLRAALRVAQQQQTQVVSGNGDKAAILQDEVNRLNKKVQAFLRLWQIIEQRLELEQLRTKNSDEQWMASKLQEQQIQLGYSAIQSFDHKSVRYVGSL